MTQSCRQALHLDPELLTVINYMVEVSDVRPHLLESLRGVLPDLARASGLDQAIQAGMEQNMRLALQNINTIARPPSLQETLAKVASLGVQEPTYASLLQTLRTAMFSVPSPWEEAMQTAMKAHQATMRDTIAQIVKANSLVHQDFIKLSPSIVQTINAMIANADLLENLRIIWPDFPGRTTERKAPDSSESAFDATPSKAFSRAAQRQALVVFIYIVVLSSMATLALDNQEPAEVLNLAIGVSSMEIARWCAFLVGQAFDKLYPGEGEE